MKKTTLLRVVPAVAAGALALYAGIGFLALPAIVKSQAAEPLRGAYQRAGGGMVQELSSRYLIADGAPGSGLLKHAVYHKPQRMGVDESCIWGDYFYFEALVRLT
eukprot:gene47107-58782_t